MEDILMGCTWVLDEKTDVLLVQEAAACLEEIAGAAINYHVSLIPAALLFLLKLGDFQQVINSLSSCHFLLPFLFESGVVLADRNKFIKMRGELTMSLGNSTAMFIHAMYRSLPFLIVLLKRLMHSCSVRSKTSAMMGSPLFGNSAPSVCNLSKNVCAQHPFNNFSCRRDGVYAKAAAIKSMTCQTSEEGRGMLSL
jgi:hypothetical protein